MMVAVVDLGASVLCVTRCVKQSELKRNLKKGTRAVWMKAETNTGKR